MDELPSSKPVKESKLPLSDTEKAIVGLHNVIETLQDQLHAVMRPDYSKDDMTKPATTAENEVGSSPLYDQMKGNLRGIVFATDRIRAIIDRLEC